MLSSAIPFFTSISQNTWQISYLQGSLGIRYDLSRQFSTHLEGEYWKGMKPTGGERHCYDLLGIAFGIHYHLFPK